MTGIVHALHTGLPGDGVSAVQFPDWDADHVIPDKGVTLAKIDAGTNDTALVFAPDGTGGVAARAETHGPLYRQDTDPGAVGAGAWWIQDVGSGWHWQIRNAADDGWVPAAYVGQGADGAVFFNPHVHVASGKAEIWQFAYVDGDGEVMTSTDASVGGNGNATNNRDAGVSLNGDAIAISQVIVGGDGTADGRIDVRVGNPIVGQALSGFSSNTFSGVHVAGIIARANAVGANLEVTAGVSGTGNAGDVLTAQGDTTALWAAPAAVPVGGTPALTLNTANAAGSAATFVRTDATILVFDATAPKPVGVAAAGSASTAAHRDHVHALPPSWSNW